MATGQLTKSWTITPNVRTAYVSLNDTMANWLYQNKAAMVGAGWTVKFSCDGVTGPTNGADATDRWTSKAACTVRATVDAAAQSWIVLTNADGLQLLLCYQGASDDICRLSMSQSGAFTLAGTTTNRPTATDELVWSAGNTIVNATASADRVISIGCTSESWWVVTFRAGAFINHIGCEKIDSACASGVFTVPYIGYRFNTTTPSVTAGAGNPMGGTAAFAASAAGFVGVAARVITAGSGRLAKFVFSGISVGNVSGTSASPPASATMNTDQPALQGLAAMPLIPYYITGEKAANLDGLLGSAIDFWFGIGSANTVPAAGDMFSGLDPGDVQGVTSPRSNWLVAFGPTMVRPWRNAAATLIMS